MISKNKIKKKLADLKEERKSLCEAIKEINAYDSPFIGGPPVYYDDGMHEKLEEIDKNIELLQGVLDGTIKTDFSMEAEGSLKKQMQQARKCYNNAISKKIRLEMEFDSFQVVKKLLGIS